MTLIGTGSVAGLKRARALLETQRRAARSFSKASTSLLEVA